MLRYAFCILRDLIMQKWQYGRSPHVARAGASESPATKRRGSRQAQAAAPFCILPSAFCILPSAFCIF
jgi:hypothetical protein